jgi:hypothetical protein
MMILMFVYRTSVVAFVVDVFHVNVNVFVENLIVFHVELIHWKFRFVHKLIYFHFVLNQHRLDSV